MIRVGIVVFDGVTLLDVSGPAEVFCCVAPGPEEGGNSWPEVGSQVSTVFPDASSPGYEVVYISASGGNVRTSSGLAIADTCPVGAVEPDLALDTLVVPGSDALARDPIPASLLDAVSTLQGRARRVASVCTGAFVLAELGLLDGRRATTHWRRAAELARRYPAVSVEADTIHVRDGRFFSSAGITAGIDLALALVEDDYGTDVARGAARELVVFLQRPGGQAQFAASAPAPGTHHPILGEVVNRVLANPAEGHTVSSMAQAAAVSPRHLNRLFLQEVGTTPARWLEGVRLDRARDLILQGSSVTQSAQRSGFGSDESLRRAFLRQYRTTPSEYRARFSTTRAGSAEVGGAA